MYGRWGGAGGRTSKGNNALSFAHCFCLVTFLLKFHSLVSGRGSCCKNNHRAKSNDPTLCQVPHPPRCPSPALRRLARVQWQSVRFTSFYRKILRLGSLLLSPTPLPPLVSCLATLTSTLPCGALRYFVYVLFIPKKCKIRAKFTSNVELTGSWWWKGVREGERRRGSLCRLHALHGAWFLVEHH